MLTDYQLLPLALVLIGYLYATQSRRAVALLLFLAGLLLPIIPWCLRNCFVSGHLFGLYWYHALENTAHFPGESVWRSLTAPRHPLFYLLIHPVDLLHKLSFGFIFFRQAGLSLLEPLTLLLSIVALFGAPVGSSRRRLAAIGIGSLFICGLFACLTWSNARFLQASTPVLACVAAAQLVAWATANVSNAYTANARILIKARAMQGLMYAGCVIFLMLPVLINLVRGSGGPKIEAAALPNQHLPTQGVVLTDIPAFVAWRWHHPALLLCQQEADLPSLEKKTDKLSGTYISPALAQLPLAETGEGWGWIATPRGIYRGLISQTSAQLPGVLRVPQDGKVQMAQDLEIERLGPGKKQLPGSNWLDAQLQVAFACLKFQRFQEAQQNFRNVIHLDPKNLEAQVGDWEALAQMHYSDVTLRLAQLTSQIATTDREGRIILEAAADHFSKLNTVPDPWLLLNLMNCHTRLKQWKELDADVTQAGRVFPKTFPVRLVLAGLYLRENELAKAATECTAVISENYDRAAAHEMAGRIALAQNQWETALQEFEIAIKLHPEKETLLAQAGNAAYRLQRYDVGERYLLAALQLSPSSIPLQLSLADLYNAAAKTNAAIELYRKILAVDASQPVALNNLAAILAKIGQLPEALALARQTVGVDPLNPHTRDTAGWIAFLASQPLEATVQLGEAIRLDPSFGAAHYHFAKTLLANGRRDDALNEFHKAVTHGLSADELSDATAILK